MIPVIETLLSNLSTLKYTQTKIAKQAITATDSITINGLLTFMSHSKLFYP